ncbi:MAG: ABC transporter ATP-binding protein, partial [Beijerinckiaceae bacterium]
RKHVQLEIRRLHQRLRRTMIYVTHDQEEALVMSDRVAVMRDGAIEQIGTPQDLYESPANTFVAGFLGESNLIEGRVTQIHDGKAEILAESIGAIRGAAAPGVLAGGRAAALIRPEAVRFGGSLPARLVERVYLGELMAFRLHLDGGTEIWQRQPVGMGEPAESAVTLAWSESGVRIIPISDYPVKQGES